MKQEEQQGMRWSWRMGQVAGIGIYMHATFPIILAWFAYESWSQTGSLSGAMVGVVFGIALFACVVLHELGHSLTARRFGIQTRDITLLPIGGVARLEKMPEDPKQELWVALAGPLVNIVIAIVLFAVIQVSDQWVWIFEEKGWFKWPFLEQLLIVNVSLAVFNMLPAFPMDGGRVVRALLGLWLDYPQATRIAATLGQAMALGFVFLGLFVNPFLILIALFVWMGAAQESNMVQVRSVLGGIPIGRAMLTHFLTLGPQDTLAQAIQQILSGSDHDFPVVDNGRVLGLLLRTDIMTNIAQKGSDVPVAEIMRTEFRTVSPYDTLEDAFAQMQESECPMLPVIHEEQLVGLVTRENLSEYLMIHAALDKSRRN